MDYYITRSDLLIIHIILLQKKHRNDPSLLHTSHADDSRKSKAFNAVCVVCVWVLVYVCLSAR